MSILNKIKDHRVNNQDSIKTILDLVELTGVIFSFPISIVFVKTFFLPSWQIDGVATATFSVILIVSWFVLSRITALAKVPRTQRYRTLIIHFLRVNFIILLILLFIKLTLGFHSIPVVFIFSYVSFSLLVTVFIRLLAYNFLKTYRSNGYNLHQVLIIADSFSEAMIEKLQTQKEWGFVIRGIITNSKLLRYKFGRDIPLIGQVSELKSLIDLNVIDEVIYCKKNIDEELIREISSLCNEIGVIFRLQSSVSPLSPLQMQLTTVNKSAFLSLVDSPSNRLSLLLKTISDIYFSIAALIILMPFLILIGILIKIDSPGPVFFIQERIGLRGRKFKLFKFRSMVQDAEIHLEKIKGLNQADGPVFKIKNDPRITSIGRFLRKTGLDELPQLYNVVKGEMSLIGPRPPLESEVKTYKRWQLRRLSVKPGLTCTWQVIPNRNDVNFEKWMAMDLHYIDNWSLLQDLQLFFATIRTIFLAKGH